MNYNTIDLVAVITSLYTELNTSYCPVSLNLMFQVQCTSVYLNCTSTKNCVYSDSVGGEELT